MSILRHIKSPFAWAVFDWGNSALATIVFTFIFPVYFARAIIGDEISGSAQWSFAIGIAGLLTALCAPVFGSITDHTGPRKPMLAAFSLLTVLLCAGLTLAAPDPSWALPALILAGGCTLFFELGQSVYNSMLQDIAPKGWQGRISGVAWGMGYFGGLACLAISLLFFVGIGDKPAILDIPQEGSWHLRTTSLLAAIWMGLFILPLFIICPDRKPTGLNAQQAVRTGIRDLVFSLKNIWHDHNLRNFLIGSAIYRDGLVTLFAVGGLYAAGQFGMSFSEILIFAIGLNIASGLGATFLSIIDDLIGAKQTIILSLLGLLLCGLAILFAANSKNEFMIFAFLLGIFIGPVQSASRNLMAQIAPTDSQTQYFGLYAMTGKSVAFTGPFAFGLLTQISGDQRWGLIAILALWFIGLMFILKIRSNDTITP